MAIAKNTSAYVWDAAATKKYGKVKTVEKLKVLWIYHEGTNSYYDPINNRLVDRIHKKYHDYVKLKEANKKPPELRSMLLELLEIHNENNIKLTVHELFDITDAKNIKNKELTSEFGSVKFYTLANISDSEFERMYFQFIESSNHIEDRYINKGIAVDKFNIDIVTAIITTIKYGTNMMIPYRSQLKQNAQKRKEEGKKNNLSFINRKILQNYCQHKMADFVRTCGIKVRLYIEFLAAMNIIEVHGGYNHWDNRGEKHTRHYRIHEAHLNGPKMYRETNVEAVTIINGFLELKARARRFTEHGASSEFHRHMMKDVITLLRQLELPRLRTLAQSKKTQMEYYGVKKHRELTDKIREAHGCSMVEWIDYLQCVVDNDSYYFNPCDEYSGRFHSPFTNTKSFLRDYVQYEGTPYISVDICNSQMIMLAGLCQNPEFAKVALGGDNQQYEIHGTQMNLFDAFYYMLDSADITAAELQAFYDHVITGKFYRLVAVKGGFACDKEAKIAVFRAIFSSGNHYLDLKDRIGKACPCVCKLSKVFNDPALAELLLPKIAQTTESTVFLNNIVKKFFKLKKFPAITVHDSIMFHPDDAELFWSIYLDFFAKLGMDPFEYKETKCKSTHNKTLVITANREKALKDKLLYLKNPAAYENKMEQRAEYAAAYRNGTMKSNYIKVSDRDLCRFNPVPIDTNVIKTREQYQFIRATY
jgi:hypothetical protein